ncbi:MAG: hypothetical protein FWE25_11380 [Lachnospiraceae bacterium]|nr:hypothetical protein [Lachnospiraceae bacterium]
MLKWKILTEDEKVSRNNKKIRGEYLGTVIFAIGMPFALVIPRLNINFPVWVLAILSSSMILVLMYSGARYFYWYHLLKAHCPDLKTENSGGEMEIFVEMEERNHLEIDNQEDRDGQE